MHLTQFEAHRSIAALGNHKPAAIARHAEQPGFGDDPTDADRFDRLRRQSSGLILERLGPLGDTFKEIAQQTPGIPLDSQFVLQQLASEYSGPDDDFFKALFAGQRLNDSQRVTIDEGLRRWRDELRVGQLRARPPRTGNVLTDTARLISYAVIKLALKVGQWLGCAVRLGTPYQVRLEPGFRRFLGEKLADSNTELGKLAARKTQPSRAAYMKALFDDLQAYQGLNTSLSASGSIIALLRYPEVARDFSHLLENINSSEPVSRVRELNQDGLIEDSVNLPDVSPASKESVSPTTLAGLSPVQQAKLYKARLNYLQEASRQGKGWMNEQHYKEIINHIEQLAKANPQLQGNVLETLDKQLRYTFALPWLYSPPGEQRPTLDEARKILDKHMFGLDSLKKRLLEIYAAELNRAERGMQQDTNNRPKALCIVGPPGVGKTALGQAMAEAMGKRLVNVQLGGVHTASAIQGFSSTYVNSEPGLLVKKLAQADLEHMDDALIMLDEVDKMSDGMFHGNPFYAVNHLLDPTSNMAFDENFLGIPLNFSHATFLLTANEVKNLPDMLRNRLQIINLPGYNFEQKQHIALEHLLNEVRQEAGLKSEELPVEAFTRNDNALIRELTFDYSPEQGVRKLRENLLQLARRRAYQVQEAREQGKPAPELDLKPADLKDWLINRAYYPVVRQPVLEPGMVHKLSVSDRGGSLHQGMVTVVSEHAREGDGGYLGIREQAKSALVPSTYGEMSKGSINDAQVFIQSHLDWVNEQLKPYDAKVEIPRDKVYYLNFSHENVAEGVDGPSAGLAYTLAAISALSGGKVRLRGDVAMTGTIQTDGRVGPIGGAMTKIEGAYRAGQRAEDGKPNYPIRKVLIPWDNAVFDSNGKVVAVKEITKNEPEELSSWITDPANPNHIEVIAVKTVNDAIRAGVFASATEAKYDALTSSQQHQALQPDAVIKPGKDVPSKPSSKPSPLHAIA